ncbi:uncharacterized protein A4U43_C04F18000 [Asparagus officinalis]|uniref:Uncharacterized protein n=1 Tax=Asparagus officinalis TaxID=4686 RepID=A0A5P1F735_ASPOF|nr:uncharacterized protein A4U43_C04F18000 [Asparagus officinalis]
MTVVVVGVITISTARLAALGAACRVGRQDEGRGRYARRRRTGGAWGERTWLRKLKGAAGGSRRGARLVEDDGTRLRKNRSSTSGAPTERKQRPPYPPAPPAPSPFATPSLSRQKRSCTTIQLPVIVDELIGKRRPRVCGWTANLVVASPPLISRYTHRPMALHFSCSVSLLPGWWLPGRSSALHLVLAPVGTLGWTESGFAAVGGGVRTVASAGRLMVSAARGGQLRR